MEHTITIPLLNPNEPDGILAAVHVNEGQKIAAGDLIFTLETTKASADISAEAEGYLVGLQCAQGENVRAGDVFAYIASSPDWRPSPAAQPAASQPSLPAGMRISQPALALARQHNLDLTVLPIGPLVTEKMIQALIGQTRPTIPSTQGEKDALAAPFDATAIIVYGGGGHGKALIDLIRTSGTYRIAGIIDDGRQAGEQIMGVTVLGGSNALPDIYTNGVRLAANAVGGISNLQTRINVFHQLAQAGFACPALVHPTAFVEASARLSPGVQVFAHAYIGSEASVGYGAIINTSAIVSHDCAIGDYTNLSPGAILAGNVHLGECSLVGMGVTINLNVSIGARARIGNGGPSKATYPKPESFAQEMSFPIETEVAMSDTNATKNWPAEVAFCRSLFEHTPISLWEMDYSQIKVFFDELKGRGVTDLDAYLDQNADVLSDCMHGIRVLDVNRKSVELFQARSKEEVIQNRVVIFRDELVRHFQEELVDLWNRRFEYGREGICYTLSGEPMDVDMRWVVLPGCEENFSHVLVAVTDITARRRAEDHLKFLTHHDPLTSLYNRYCYEEELSRLENSRRFPVTIVLAELAGLKEVNSRLGTTAGNGLLCRAGEVLKAAFRNEDIVARTSSHQFAVILPQTDENAAARAIERIDRLIQLNNEFYQGPALVFAISQATGHKGCSLQEIHQEAERKLQKGITRR